MYLYTRHVIIVGAILTALILGWQIIGWHSDQWIHQPMLDVEERIVDLGIVPKEVKVTRAIRVYNRGQGVLKISDVRTGCGCTEVAIGSPEVAPSSFTELRISLVGKSTLRETGGRTDVYLFTNDPEESVCHLLVHYRSSAEPFLDPSHIDFGQVIYSDLPVIEKCSVVCPDNSSDFLWLERASASVNAAFLRAITTYNSGVNELEVQVVLEKDAPFGELYYPLQIVGSEGAAVFETSIIGNVKGWCFALPQAVDFGNLIRIGESVTKTVQFKNRNEGHSVRIKECRISDTLKGVLKIEIDDGVESASVVITACPRRNRGIWSTHQYCGYFMALCADSDGEEHWTAVPVRLSTVAPKDFDKITFQGVSSD